MTDTHSPVSPDEASASEANVLIGLAEAPAKLVAEVARDVGATPLIVNDRASLLKAVEAQQPDVAVIDGSPGNDWGGAALGGVLTKMSPATRLLYVGPDEHRLRIEALLTGDLYLAQPLERTFLVQALQTLLVKAGLGRTGRYRRSKRVDTKAIKTAAMHHMSRRLVAARRTGEVAEIVKGVLAEVLTFDAFAFAAAPEDQRLQLRWYLDTPLAQQSLDAAQDSLLSQHAHALGTFDVEQVRARIYGPVKPQEATSEADVEPLCEHVWLLRTANDAAPVGVVGLYRHEQFALPAPVAEFVDELLELAALALSRINSARFEQFDLLRMMIDSLSEGRLWIEARNHRILANAKARQLLNLPAEGPIKRSEVLERFHETGLYEDFFGPMGRGEGHVEVVRPLPGSDVPQEIFLFRIRKRLYTIGLLIAFRDAAE